MATLKAVLSALVAQVAAATTGLVDSDGDPIDVRVARDYPPEGTLAATARGDFVAIGIIDRKVGRSITEWGPRTVLTTVSPATLTSTFGLAGDPAVPVAHLRPGASVVLTLGGSVTAGDAVSLAAQVAGDAADAVGVVDSPQAGATPASVAAGLAAQAAANPALAGLVGVVATGAQITVTSRSAANLFVQSGTGNGGQLVTELGRTQRQMQMIVWAACEDDRGVVGDRIEQLLAQVAVYDGLFYMGLPLASGEAAQVIAGQNFDVDDAILSGSYRRDFLFGVEYALTVTDALWSVLVTSGTFKT